MSTILKMLIIAAAVTATAFLGACENADPITQVRVDTVRVTVRDTVRIGNTAITFTQVERLANPLVNEVLVEKREHTHYNSSTPNEDRAQFRDDIISFITGVARRDAAYAGAVADALLPDMLFIRMDKPRGTNDANVGWVTYVLDPANGWGGRKLTGDDVVDKATAVVFGNALGNNTNVSAGLVGDNVNANDRPATTTFPYFPIPN